MILHILSNINMSPIEPMLLPWFDEVIIGGYNQVIQDIITLDDNKATEARLIWIHLDSAEWSPADNSENLDAIFSILNAIESSLNRPESSHVMFSNMPPAGYTVHTQNRQFRAHEFNVRQQIENRLATLSQRFSGFTVFNFEKLVFEHGRQNMYDPKYWYMGRIRYAMAGFEIMKQEVVRVQKAINGDSCKVLVLDLDNTLWGGIVGEDGPHGIMLSEDGIGKAYRDFQKNIKALQESGVILGIVSRNNEHDAREGFNQNHMMVLGWEDFSSRRINWNPKPDNITSIANELNLSLDSFVFIDDNPVERDIVRQMLPVVNVPHMPEDPSTIPDWFVRDVVNEYFNRTTLTATDAGKTGQYQRQSQRREIAATLSLDDYIHSLDIRTNIHINPENQIARISQLTQKTNQFNLTGRRYTESDIGHLIRSAHSDVFALDYEDKFGKEGIVGVIICTYNASDIIAGEGKQTSEDTASSCLIDTFLLSCRVIGRKVEHLFIRMFCEAVSRKGTVLVYGKYIMTPKNILVKDTYSELGFTLEDDHFVGSPCDIMANVHRYLPERSDSQ